MIALRQVTTVTLAAAALLLIAPGLTGCAATFRGVAPGPAEHAQREIPDAQLLNINIAVFDPGVSAKNSDDRTVFPEVRKAEARFMPVTLRQTLQDTGFWGAVRVVPEPVAYSELLVTGTILQSNGLSLALKMHARDASGRVWLDKTYQADAQQPVDGREHEGKEPFQRVYNRIADDLLAVRRELKSGDLRRIRELSEMRFAGDLAPETFDRYVAKNGSHYKLKGLPAAQDPMLARVDTIRKRDYRLIDTLDAHYRVFHQRIRSAYNDYRQSSYTEAKQVRKLHRQALGREVLGALAVLAGIAGATQARTPIGSLGSQAAVLGGAVLIGSGVAKGREVKIHAEALKELGKSLEADVKPRVVKLKGQTVTLSGSAKEQYRQWRGLLKDLYRQETGFGPAGNSVSRPATPDR